MVVVEALKCLQCFTQYDGSLIGGSYHGISTCPKGANRLICSICTRAGRFCPCYPRNVITESSYFFSKFCTFLSYGPEEELCLIDLQTALNVNCSKCKCKRSDLYRHNIHQVLCLKCGPPDCSWLVRSSLETIFLNIIRELNVRDVMPRTRPLRDGVSGRLPVKVIANCGNCNIELGVLSSDSYRSIMVDGVNYCLSCGDQARKFFTASHSCHCLSRLIDFIQCIPENQLHLLTYSKWLNALGCKKHQDMLYALNAVSSDGSTTGKLRSFFKKEHVEKQPIPKSVPIVNKPIKSVKPVVSAHAAADYKKKLSTLRSKLDQSTPDRMLPDRITCSCEREEDVSNMFDCFTCPSYGVCGLCVTKKHWGHEIKESLKTLAPCLIGTQSEVARQKLSTWLGQSKEMSEQGEHSFEKMCRTLGVLYKHAMNCEDLQRIQSLLTRANTSEIEKIFKNAMNSTRTLYKSMDSFCVDLLNAVEETENTNSTVKEAPRVYRK